MPTSQTQIPRGATLGRYVVLERLGVGSMGVVYAAYDPQLDRRIAIKLLRGGGASTADSRTRFLREAQAMARLSHPNVVQVYDAGELPGEGGARGVVFIAMEHVQGRTLRAWLAERRRTVPEILAVFAQAGRGLVAAHAAGIVHRDFKPENVLVDVHDRARVTDFGLARSLADGATPDAAEGPTPPAALTMTGTGLILGTPAYAAPEQFTGDPVDHRTDQFSFCVALYEALYGQRPFADGSEEELVFSVTMGRLLPAPPDSAVPGWIRDLLIRGLSPRPAGRHASMDRLLHGLAHDPRRRRRFVAAAAVAALGVAAIGYGTTWVAWHAQPCQGAPRKLAGVWDDPRRRTVEASLRATGRPFSAAAARGAVQALDEYAAGWTAMHTDACQATRVREEQPEAVMDLRMRCLDRRLGELSALVDLLSHADAQVAERAVSAAHGLRDLRLCADRDALEAVVEPADERLRAPVDAARRELDRASALLAAGHYAEAQKVAREATDRARTLGYAPLLAEALLLRGEAEMEAGDPAAAEATLHEAVGQAEIARDDETRGQAWAQLVKVTGLWRGEFQEAYRSAEQARAVAERLGAGHELLRAEIATWLGFALRDDGRAADGLAQFQAALALRERVLPAGHIEILGTRHAIAEALADLGRLEDAVAEERRVIPALEAALGADHPRVATSHDTLGCQLTGLGRYREAVTEIERGLAVRRGSLGEEDVEVAFSLSNLAITRARMGDPRGALPVAEEALRRVERAEGRSLYWATMSFGLGEIHRAAGDIGPAAAQQLVALEAARKAGGPDHPQVAVALAYLAECDLAEGHPANALARFRQAAGIHERRLGPEHPELSHDLGGVGRALLALGRSAEALEPLERARRLAHDVPPGDQGAIAFALARARWETGRREQALEDARAARTALSRGEGLDRRLLPAVERWLEQREPRAAATPARAP